jgi:hypothetical protein
MTYNSRMKKLFLIRNLIILPLIVILITAILVYKTLTLKYYITFLYNETQDWDLSPIVDIRLFNANHGSYEAGCPKNYKQITANFLGLDGICFDGTATIVACDSLSVYYVPLSNFSNSIICVKRILNITYHDLAASRTNSTCPSGTRKCGPSLDNDYSYCVSSEYNCTVNEIEFAPMIYDNNYIADYNSSTI